MPPKLVLSETFPAMPALMAPVTARLPVARLIETLPSLVVTLPDPMIRLLVSLTVSDSPESLIRATSVVIFVLSDDVVLAVTLRILPVIVPTAVSPPLARFSVILPLLVRILPPSIVRSSASFTISELPRDVRLAVTEPIAVFTVTPF